MKAECQWISTNLEAFFCDRLTAEETRRVYDHIQACLDCHQQVEGIRQVDAVVRRYFRQQLARARVPQRRRFAWAYAAATAGLAALFIIGITLQLPNPQAPSPTVSVPAAAPEIKKINEPTEIRREKPQDTGSRLAEATPRPSRPVTPPGAAQAEFLVTDPAGYSRTLDDYRGYVLLLGIVGLDQPQAAANMERVYKTFGPNTQVRVLGIIDERETRPQNTTFPVAYNQDSRLFDASAAELIVIDQSGEVRLRTSLLEDSRDLIQTLRATLEK
jgi:hypothetical protein